MGRAREPGKDIAVDPLGAGCNPSPGKVDRSLLAAHGDRAVANRERRDLDGERLDAFIVRRVMHGDAAAEACAPRADPIRVDTRLTLDVVNGSSIVLD